LTPVSFSHLPPTAFRAARDYVHSTDIYEEILAGARSMGLAPAGPVDLRMRSRMSRHPIYHFRLRDAAAAGHAAATADIVLGETPWSVDVIETPDPVTAHKPYDETPVWSRTRQDGESFSFESDPQLRPIETVTAIGVLLHKTLFPPPAGKRWLFARLLIDRLLDERDSRRVVVSLERRLGASTTRSRVAGDDGTFGSMMFILG
jgi:hypothetical protein